MYRWPCKLSGGSFIAFVDLLKDDLDDRLEALRCGIPAIVIPETKRRDLARKYMKSVSEKFSLDRHLDGVEKDHPESFLVIMPDPNLPVHFIIATV